MHDPTATDGPTTRRTAGMMAAIVAATIGLVLTLGTGTASAQALEIVEPGTLGAETGNRFCYNFQTTGQSSTENVTYGVTDPGDLPPGVFVLTHTFGAVAPLQETRWGFSGTPTTPGTYTVTVTATDDNGTPTAGDDIDADPVTMTIEVGTEASADIVVHAGRLGLGYTIDCQSSGRETQGFLRDLDNFGTGGTVGSRLAIRNHTPFDPATDTGEPITAAQLATVDILLDGWVWDGTWTPQEIRDIGTWVNGGGVLIAAEDRNVADTLGRMFGAPTNPINRLCTHTPSEAGDPSDDCPELSATALASDIVDGPFGDWAGDPLNTSGSVGHFGATPPAGWTEIASWATDPRDGVLPPQFVGNAAVITRAVGNGRVILLNDEALWRTQSFPGSANATFVGNLMAYAIDEIGGGANPQPALADNSYTVESGTAFSRNPCTNDPDDATAGNATVFVDTPLPAGVTLTPGTCALAGTATEDFSFAYQRSAGGVTAWAVVEVEVDLVPDLSPDTFDGVVGEPFNRGVCANDAELGDAPVTTAIVSGSLPPGLALNDCRIQGTPTTAGSFTARYRVTDADGDTDTAQVTITITEPDTPTPPPTQTFRCKGEVATIVGTMGADTLTGTPGRDVIVGRGGNDTIRGRGGNDLICAGGGRDTVRGNAGNDRIFGQGGNDVLRGGGGADRVVGNAGNDRLAGNAGAPDRCIGGPGVDRFLRGCEIRRQ